MKLFQKDDLGLAELTPFGVFVSISSFIILVSVFGYLLGGF